MIITKGNLFDQKADAIVIPVNGYYTFQNHAIMGKGVALQAAKKFPILKKKLGYMLQMHGTHVFMLSKKKKLGGVKLPYDVVTFPTKPRSGISQGPNVVKHLRTKFNKDGMFVPGWALKSDIKLIKKSAIELRELAAARGWKRVVLPKVGSGAGEVDWKRIYRVLKRILKGRVFVLVEID